MCSEETIANDPMWLGWSARLEMINGAIFFPKILLTKQPIYN